MKITHFCNSFIAVEKANTTLLCDPWIGTANHGGWLSYPISGNPENIIEIYKPSHVYISHLHTDHFCEPVLSLIHKETPIIIKDFKDRRLYKKLCNLGFKQVFEVEPWTAFKLKEDLEVFIVPADNTTTGGIECNVNYDLDTSLIVRSIKDDTWFYNGVDNPISLEAYERINSLVSSKSSGAKIDVACIAVGAASEYPQCFLNIDREKEQESVIKQSLDRFATQIEKLRPEVYFPAGGTYIIPGKYCILNKFIAQPSEDELKSAVESSKQCKYFFNIEGGYSIEKKENKWVRHESKVNKFISRSDSIQFHCDLKYEYQSLPEPPLLEIESLFERAKLNYCKVLEQKSIPIEWTINFILYNDLQLNKNAAIMQDTEVTGRFTITDSAGSAHNLVCHLDSRLFAGLLKRDFIWNISLSGSIILFDRKPNKFIPDIPFSLNYLTV